MFEVVAPFRKCSIRTFTNFRAHIITLAIYAICNEFACCLVAQFGLSFM